MIALSRAFQQRFEVLRTLGEGGMGIVLLARDRQLGREVAVKVVKALSEGQLERFMREGQVLAGLRHPGIMRVYDLGVDEGRPYLVCELSSGQTLETVMQERIPLSRALGIVRSTAEALAHAHDQGIIHRDLKPENVQIVGETSIQLLDFGIALPVEMAGALTEPGLVLGTPAYMSPEQVLGRELRGTTDQFSLGVVAFEMLTGSSPFPGTTVMEVASARLQTTPPAPGTLVAGIPGPVDEMVLRLLARSPEARYSSMHELVEVLDRIGAAPAPEPSLPPSRSRGLQGARSGVILVTRSGVRPAASRSSMSMRSSQALQVPAGVPRPRWLVPAILLGLVAAGAGIWAIATTRSPPEPVAPVLVEPASPSPETSRPSAQQVLVLKDLIKLRGRLHDCRKELGTGEKGSSSARKAVETRAVDVVSRAIALLRRADAAFRGPSWLTFEAELRPLLEMAGRIQDSVDPMGGPVWQRLLALGAELSRTAKQEPQGPDPFRLYSLRMSVLVMDKITDSAADHYVRERWAGIEELVRAHPGWATSPDGWLERLRVSALVAHLDRLPAAARMPAVTSLTEALQQVLGAGLPAGTPDRTHQRILLQCLISVTRLLEREPELTPSVRPLLREWALRLAEHLSAPPDWVTSWGDEFPVFEFIWAFRRIEGAFGKTPATERLAQARQRIEAIHKSGVETVR